MNVIFHLDEQKKWTTLASNVKNFYDWTQAENEPSTIEVLINGEASELTIKNSPVDFSPLIALNISITVCQNSLDSRGYSHNQLQNGLSVVPVGVVELARQQMNGYAYIKP